MATGLYFKDLDTTTDVGDLLGAAQSATDPLAKGKKFTYSNDGTLAGESNANIPTEAAVKTYADTLDSNNVHLNGTETITGPKNFTDKVTISDGGYVNLDNLDASSLLVTDASKTIETTTALMNGITATTQSAADNSTKVATTAYADTAANATITATASNIYYLNSNRTDTYTETGTQARPFKTLSAAITAINASSYTSYVLIFAPGTYNEPAGLSFPDKNGVIYGNRSTINVSTTDCFLYGTLQIYSTIFHVAAPGIFRWRANIFAINSEFYCDDQRGYLTTISYRLVNCILAPEAGISVNTFRPNSGQTMVMENCLCLLRLKANCDVTARGCTFSLTLTSPAIQCEGVLATDVVKIYNSIIISPGQGITYNNPAVTASNPHILLGNTITAAAASAAVASTNGTVVFAKNHILSGTLSLTNLIGFSNDIVNANNINSGVVGVNYGGAGTVNGIMKANGAGVVSAATAGTDYISPVTLPLNINSPAPGQFLSYNGTYWINSDGGTNTSQVGSGVTFFLDQAILRAAGDDNTVALKTLTKVPTSTSETDETATTNSSSGKVPLAYFWYNYGLGGTSLDGGPWQQQFFAKVSAVSGTTTIVGSYFRVIEQTETITTTGTGTSRTATASGGTIFESGDVNADASLASYLITPSGIYRITAYTSATVVTIEVPSSYSNESAVAFYRAVNLFTITSDPIIDTILAVNWVPVVETAKPIDETDGIMLLTFAATTSATDVTVTMTTNGVEHNSLVVSAIIMRHNDTKALQGGNGSDEYYHLSEAGYDAVLYNETKGVWKADGGSDDNSGKSPIAPVETFDEAMTVASSLSPSAAAPVGVFCPDGQRDGNATVPSYVRFSGPNTYIPSTCIIYPNSYFEFGSYYYSGGGVAFSFSSGTGTGKTFLIGKELINGKLVDSGSFGEIFLDIGCLEQDSSSTEVIEALAGTTYYVKSAKIKGLINANGGTIDLSQVADLSEATFTTASGGVIIYPPQLSAANTWEEKQVITDTTEATSTDASLLTEGGITTKKKINCQSTTEATSTDAAILTEGGITAKKKIYAGTALLLPCPSGGTRTDLNLYERTTQELTFSGPWASNVDITATIEQIGHTVMVTLPTIMAVGNSTSAQIITSSTALPTRFFPSTSFWMPVVASIGGATIPATCELTTDGNIRIRPVGRTTFSPGTNVCGAWTFTFIYSI